MWVGDPDGINLKLASAKFFVAHRIVRRHALRWRDTVLRIGSQSFAGKPAMVLWVWAQLPASGRGWMCALHSLADECAAFGRECAEADLRGNLEGREARVSPSLRNRDFGTCASCENRPWCKVCPAANFNATKSLSTPPSGHCAFAQVVREVYGDVAIHRMEKRL